MFEALKLKPWAPPPKIKKQKSIRETIEPTIKYYCACCQSECIPIFKKPLIENKVMDKIEVSF